MNTPTDPPTPVSPCLGTPGEGPVYHAFGEVARFHLTGKQTGGRLTMWTEITPPNGGPPPHRHAREDEWFVVRKGQFEFFLNGHWHAAPPGTTVYLPRGCVHTFRNSGEREGELLISTSPSGFETYFAECAAVFNQPGPPEMERIAAISDRHGIEFVQPA